MGDRIEQLIVLGREHYNAGELERAEPLLSEAAAARPRFPDLYNMLGVIYHGQGRFQDAEEAFETALRLNPRYTEAALNLSVTYNDRGKYDRAREVYARAVSASAGQPHALDQFARGKLANMHADLGAAYAGLAMFDEAVREYVKALDLCPEFADLRVRLGNVYRDMGVHHAAIAEFEHAKRIRPDYAPAGIHLGVTLFSLGRRDDAIAEWKAVLANDPANRSAQLYIRMVSDEHGPKPGSALAR
jgi:tetratricopeptide (TPR) repeat protein